MLFKGFAVVVSIEAKVLWIKLTQHEDFTDELVYVEGSELFQIKPLMHITQGYWIIQGRSAVKKVMNQCRIYWYFKTTSLVQNMALLPEEQ